MHCPGLHSPVSPRTPRSPSLPLRLRSSQIVRWCCRKSRSAVELYFSFDGIAPHLPWPDLRRESLQTNPDACDFRYVLSSSWLASSPSPLPAPSDPPPARPRREARGGPSRHSNFWNGKKSTTDRRMFPTLSQGSPESPENQNRVILGRPGPGALSEASSER